MTKTDQVFTIAIGDAHLEPSSRLLGPGWLVVIQVFTFFSLFNIFNLVLIQVFNCSLFNPCLTLVLTQEQPALLSKLSDALQAVTAEVEVKFGHRNKTSEYLKKKMFITM